MRRLVTTAMLLSLPAWAGPIDGKPPTQILALLMGLIVLGTIVFVGLLSLVTLYAVLRPRKVQAGARILRAHPARSLAMGVLLGVIGLLLVNLADRLPQALGGPLGLVVLAAYAWWLVAGLAMLCHELGERLQTNLGLGSTGVGLKAIAWGLLLVVLPVCIPFVGWAVQLFLALTAVGTAVSLFFVRSPGADTDTRTDMD